jgi:lipopolysaccharide export system protein LptC
MSIAPLLRSKLPTPGSRDKRVFGQAGDRQPPSADGIARRRRLIRLTKIGLPALALALLAVVALWPEIDRAKEHATIGFRSVNGEIDGAKLTNARYRGVDENGRPYTVTADIARQDTPERVELTMPIADLTERDGSWLMLRARHGTYLQKLDQLDLLNDVVLYRDDGLTMETASAAIDLRNGAAASGVTVHVEGPFGTLDAQGFTLVDKGTAVQFTGPARLVMNGAAPKNNEPEKTK